MRKGRDGGEKWRKKKKEKNGVFSGHYVIASSLPAEWLRPNDDRWNAARSCQKTANLGFWLNLMGGGVKTGWFWAGSLDPLSEFFRNRYFLLHSGPTWEFQPCLKSCKLDHEEAWFSTWLPPNHPPTHSPNQPPTNRLVKNLNWMSQIPCGCQTRCLIVSRRYMETCNFNLRTG